MRLLNFKEIRRSSLPRFLKPKKVLEAERFFAFVLFPQKLDDFRI
eukprot:12219.XXX_840445_840579_1 [CDS] Oithona nana genome sequencing.